MPSELRAASVIRVYVARAVSWRGPGGEVRRLTDDRLLLRRAFADQVADDHQPGGDPDARLELGGFDIQPTDRVDQPSPVCETRGDLDAFHAADIRVHAAGVNFADSLMVGGTYQVKPQFPFTPGLEAAGEIVETGSAVDGLRVGQRALAVLRNGGSYAEEIVLDAAAVVPIPDAMDFVRAAAFPVAYGTAHFALTHRGHLQPGETLLVLGAAGGVGLTAVEIGKAMGARVIAAAGELLSADDIADL